MIKNDKWIQKQAELMITPFESKQIREVHETAGINPGYYRNVVSYGLSSYGYDIRLSPKDFRIFRHLPGKVIDPKNFNTKHLESTELFEDEGSHYFILPGNSYGLGVSLERVSMPKNVTAICMGKSTYARCGIIVHITPIEASWSGHITLEFSNASNADARIYANEGVIQLLFFEGEDCGVSYADRKGKYQDQSEEVTIARI